MNELIMVPSSSSLLGDEEPWPRLVDAPPFLRKGQLVVGAIPAEAISQLLGFIQES